MSQEKATAATTVGSIEGWIQDLRAPVFGTRRTASASLRNAGNAAIEPLTKALQTATAEQKIRIQQILQELQQNSFARRLERLRKTPSVELAKSLPEWNRFSKIAGADRPSLDLYIRVLSAEPSLFIAVEKENRSLPTLVQNRAAQLVQMVRPAPGRTNRFLIDSYAAILLLVSDNDRRASGNTSTSVSTLLNYDGFTEALQQPGGKLLLRLAAAYIMRERIDLKHPFSFARVHRVPEGPILARRVLLNALRGHNGIYAMMLLLEQGDKSDIALLETLFNNQGIITRATGLRNVAPTYRAYNGDMALAVAIAMRKQDPRDYGFGKQLPRAEKFRFVLETIGFNSEQERAAAHKKYQLQFQNEDAQTK